MRLCTIWTMEVSVNTSNDNRVILTSHHLFERSAKKKMDEWTKIIKTDMNFSDCKVSMGGEPLFL